MYFDNNKMIDALFYYTGFLTTVMFMAPSLAFMVVYVWSRRNPHVRMSFLGLFTFNAPYLPWVILGFGLLLNQNPIFDVLGIAVGHIYYWLEDVYPTISGRRLLRTPGFLYVYNNTTTIKAQVHKPIAGAFWHKYIGLFYCH